ncbi:RICIN domain-containing protein [Hymenobacter jeollabukensis]|uniref:T9SS type A sorting domain-containing protein n=1 Tax=Hymenobacter jeollabukensis TaxID=2025313 RepID=A0A5R8WXB5_9BACT|nr:RICIN domain-containing protein [Hymenobacter jeollabukensis]TLM97161.1 T9SS type A sorting domain-containing protein [Hymenobacter jeollabukensis]
MQHVSRLLIGLLAGGGALHAPAALAQTVNLWVTTGDQTKLLQPQTALNFVPSTGTATTTITIDEATTYQTIDGFGASMTGASAYLLNQKMSAAQRDALLNELFTGAGIRLGFLRHSMGASDFSAYGNYTYDDKPTGQTDPMLASFNLGQDLTDVVPMLQAARAKNGSLKIMGTPWTAPTWMKEVNTQWNGSWLSTAWYQTYANYFVKYVQAMQAQGLPVYAVTLQNEPLYAAPYVSMRMDAGNQAAFLKNNIGPAFQAAGLTTKLIAYDHNWDHPEYPNAIFADAAAAQYAAGSAFHGYGGAVSGQTTTHNAYPNKDIWFTEISGSVGSSFAGDLKWHLSNIIIGTTRNWAKSALEWNLALDQNNGPTNGGCTNCRGVVTINNATGAVTRNVEYYALGHASKFVDAGAVRLSSNTVAGGIENVAFRNPDGTRVLIALNNSTAAKTFKLIWDGQSFIYTLPAGAAATYKWDGNEPRIGRLYEISSKNGGKALEIAGSSTSNGGQAQQKTWTAASNQKWKLVDTGSGYVRVVNLFSNKSLDIAGPSTSNGALVQQWDWLSQDDQYWQVLGNGDGTYRLQSKYSGKVLDVQGNSTADNALIQQWDYTGGNNQRWWFSDQGAVTRTALATASPEVDARLAVYPTVVGAELAFTYAADRSQELAVQLVDVLGRSVAQLPRTAHAGPNQFTLDVAGFPAGVYTLRVATPDGQLQRRVLISR